jgi:hypothetical protein
LQKTSKKYASNSRWFYICTFNSCETALWIHRETQEYARRLQTVDKPEIKMAAWGIHSLCTAASRIVAWHFSGRKKKTKKPEKKKQDTQKPKKKTAKKKKSQQKFENYLIKKAKRTSNPSLFIVHNTQKYILIYHIRSAGP